MRYRSVVPLPERSKKAVFTGPQTRQLTLGESKRHRDPNVQGDKVKLIGRCSSGRGWVKKAGIASVTAPKME
jgi:hypothetical protein